jgi:urease accessory protein
MAADADPDAETDAGAETGSDADVDQDTRTDADPEVPHPAFAAYAGETVPQASPGAPGKDGRLELAFADVDGRTRVVREFARAPFHVSGSLDHDPMDGAATVYVQSPTGGVAQGDRRAIDVSVGSGAVAHVSTASATKVYSMDTNYGQADVSLSVADGGHLDYVPGATILHADARFCQSLTLDVAPGGSAVLGEVVVPGRLARGEAFEFERYYSRVRVRGPEDLLVEDATHLSGDRPSRVPGVLGDAAVYGTLFVVAPAADAPTLSDAIHDCLDVDLAGATHLPNGAGVLVRALGETAVAVREPLRAAWDRARRDLVDAPVPPRRK